MTMNMCSICKYAYEETIKTLNKQLAQMKEEKDALAALAEERARQKEEKQAEVEAGQALNAGLKRIMRERSNAARSITPKKEHDGFLAIRSEQYLEHSDGNEFVGWRTVLQTPYSAELDFSQACLAIEEDVFGGGIIKELGCDEVDLACDPAGISDEDSVVLYRVLYKADYRSSYWEMVLFTTGTLCVPKNRMPQPPKKK